MLHVVPAGIVSFPTGFVIEGSGLFNGTDGKLTRTISSAGNRRTFILETIFKLGGSSSSFLTAYSSGTDTFYSYLSSDAVYVQNYVSSTQMELKSEAVLRDPTAWYHLIVAIDTTQATDTNRVKAWVNGVELTWLSSPRTYPSENLELKWNTGSQEHQIGHSATTYSTEYFARAAAYDGLTMTDPATDAFGEFDNNGVWIVLDVSGKNFGTTGFLIEGGAAFTNGTDSSSNSENFTKGGTITNVKDTLTDKASDNFGNYPVWNLAHSSIDHSTSVIDSVTEGNLRATVTSNNSSTIFSTMASPASGKYMIRFVNKDASNNSNILVGLQDTSQALPAYNSSAGIGTSGQRSVVYRFSGGYLYINGTNSHQYTTAASADNTLDLAWDADTGKVWIAVNGTWQDGEGNTGGGSTDIAGANTGNVATLTSGYQYAIACSMWDTTSVFIDQDGGTLPTDFKRFNTANLPAPTVTDPSKFFDTVIYEGTGAELSTGDTGVAALSFQPDFVWIKNRDANDNHVLYDVIRGATKDLHTGPDTGEAQTTTAQTLKSFDANGFTLGTDVQVNTNNESYVAWCWKAGGSSSTNDDGATQSNVSVASHGGFSVVTHTGTGANTTIGHGLSRAPNFTMHKNTATTDQWIAHSSFVATPTTQYLHPNRDLPTQSGGATFFNSTVPTASVISLGSNSAVNGSSQLNVHYCFAKTKGLIGIGSYTGNGNADGPRIVVDDGGSGFRPAWIMFKNITTDGYGWSIFDVKRNSVGNPNSTALNMANNTVDSTVASYKHDILANGFKIRGNSGETNKSGDTIIYLAFAENPFGGDSVAQAKAR